MTTNHTPLKESHSSPSLKDFSIITKLGDGSFGTVFKVKRISDGKIYALKKVKMHTLRPKDKENALNEVRILASVNDPYIVSYKESFFEESENCLCIVMEFCEGGDILKLIEKSKKNHNYIKEMDI